MQIKAFKIFDPIKGFLTHSVPHAGAQWLRCCATNMKVARSFADGDKHKKTDTLFVAFTSVTVGRVVQSV